MITNKKKDTKNNQYETFIKAGIGLLLIVAGATGSNIDRFWITPEELEVKLEKYVTKEEFLKNNIEKDNNTKSDVNTKTEEIKNLLKLSNGIGIGEK